MRLAKRAVAMISLQLLATVFQSLLLHRHLPNHGANQWPSNSGLPSFCDAISAYSAQASLLALRLMRLNAQSLGMISTVFESVMQYPTTTTRFLNYPPQAHAGASAIGSGNHTDWGALTILAQDDRWIAIDPKPGVLIINMGDLVQRWTKDLYRSSWHRVVNRHAGRAIFDCVFF